MSRADELRAALRVAELEEDLARMKDDDAPGLAEAKHELRYARWVSRGGPAEEHARLDDGGDHTNRATALHFERWQNEGGQQSGQPDDETEMAV